jgi:hypothetical protein
MRLFLRVLGVFARVIFFKFNRSLLTLLLNLFHVIGQRPPISAIDSHTIARSL